MYRGYYNQNKKCNFSLFIIFDGKRANIFVLRRMVKEFLPFLAPWFTVRDSLCTSCDSEISPCSTDSEGRALSGFKSTLADVTS